MKKFVNNVLLNPFHAADLLIPPFLLMYRYGINKTILHLTFSRAEF